MAKMVSVKVFETRQEAEVARNLLDSAGVSCVVPEGVSGEICLLVSEHDASWALRILGECCVSDERGADSAKELVEDGDQHMPIVRTLGFGTGLVIILVGAALILLVLLIFRGR